MIIATNRNDEFFKYLLRALLSHCGAGLILFLVTYVLNVDFFSSEINNKDVKIIESAVRVDLVAMPKLTVLEKKKLDLTQTTPEVIPAKIEGKSNETSYVEFKKVGKKVNLSNLLKNLSKNKVVKKKTEKTKPKINQQELKKLVLEGNIVSKGSTAVGSGQIHSDENFVNYIQSLPDRIRPNWKLPSYLLEKNLRCRLRVFLAANGKVLRITVFESSGDQEYDQKAIEAVRASSPLPLPGRDILARVSAGDVILGFPL